MRDGTNKKTHRAMAMSPRPRRVAMPGASLRPELGEHGLSSNEHKLVDNVTKGVRLGKDTAPYYMDHGWPADISSGASNSPADCGGEGDFRKHLTAFVYLFESADVGN